MLIACGITCVLIGSLGFVGQLISTINFALAQRLGLQEKADQCEALFSHLELNTARWDLAVTWTLPLAGVLMLLGSSAWPYVALVGGGIYLDTGGREVAKLLALRSHEVGMGTSKEQRLTIGFLFVLSAVGLWAIVMAAAELMRIGQVS